MERDVKAKEKKGMIYKTLERCKWLGHRKAAAAKSKLRAQVRPEGCVTVRVGPDKERFMIRTESVNHPLFKELLDEAESEYGYPREGPVELPCAVDRFSRVLWEIEEEGCQDTPAVGSPLCSFHASPMRRGHAGYRILNPSRLVIAGRI